MKAALRLNTRSADIAKPLYLLLVFCGSFLLFVTQPMIARLALPRLGGASAVWNSAMLVYQALLLGGYYYAHRLSRLPARRSSLVHGAMFLVAACWLPIGLRGIDAPAGLSPALWVPWLLVTSIGPLFFVVSAQAPLMQRWYAATEPGANPYPLYAASNLGSFAGLLSYPLVIEPMMTVSAQRHLWTLLYGLLMVAVVAAAAMLPAVARQPRDGIATTPAPSRRQWWRWALLAAVPSGLMLSTTTHLTTDIAAMPMLWILPLGLYLVSFSIAFATDRRPARAITRIAPVLLVLCAALSLMLTLTPGLAIVSAVSGLALLLVVSVALHATMYASRPDPAHLTSFYLASSTGGVLGGAFCALIAPLLFDWTWEHPILILAATALIPTQALWPTRATVRFGQRFRLVAIIAGPVLAVLTLSLLGAAHGMVLAIPAALASVALALASIGSRVVFTWLTCCVMLACGGGMMVAMAIDGAYSRSYFGVYTVIRTSADHVVKHGTTLHGMQLMGPGKERVPTTYYAPGGGVGRALRAAPALFGDHARIGVVGLGAGTLACYARPGQDWRFYEIDPEVERIARAPADFTFLSACAPKAPVVIGDARLTLSHERQAFDLLVIDAFSSDAVPLHMLTREAFSIYRQRIGDQGLLLLNLTNRWIDLPEVVGDTATRNGWTAVILPYRPDAAAARLSATPSIWVAVSRSPERIRQLEAETGPGWRSLGDHGKPTWTDDYASVLPYIRIGGGWR